MRARAAWLARTGGSGLESALGVFLAAVLASGCATVPPQVRPATPEAFLGRWSGTWESERGPWAGHVELDILQDPARPNGVRFTSRWTNAIVPAVSMNGVFEAGELVFQASGGSGLRCALHGEGHMRAKYRFANPNNRVESGSLVLGRVRP